MSGADQHCFVVRDAKENAYFEVDFALVDDRAQKYLQSVWQRLSLALENYCKIGGQDIPAWVTWTPWKWTEDKRIAYQPRQKFAAWSGPNLLGILNLWNGFSPSGISGEESVYVEHLAASPGNLNTALWQRRYTEVGVALFAFSIKFSHEQLGGAIKILEVYRV